MDKGEGNDVPCRAKRRNMWRGKKTHKILLLTSGSSPCYGSHHRLEETLNGYCWVSWQNNTYFIMPVILKLLHPSLLKIITCIASLTAFNNVQKDENVCTRRVRQTKPYSRLIHQDCSINVIRREKKEKLTWVLIGQAIHGNTSKWSKNKLGHAAYPCWTNLIKFDMLNSSNWQNIYMCSTSRGMYRFHGHG